MDEMDDIPPGQPTILMRITKILVDYVKNKAWEMMDELEWMEDNLERESDELILKKLKMEVTKKLEQNCWCLFSWRRNMTRELDYRPFFLSSNKLGLIDAMDELKKMEKMLDLEQESDKLMMEKIKMLKMEVMKELVKYLDYFSFLPTNKAFHAMDELKTMEKMLDLEQESDKLMMEEIKILKMKVMKSLVKNLDYFSLLPTNKAFHAMDELKTMEKMLDLEQESDKLMMEEIKILKMKVMKSLVKNLDYFSLLPTNKAFHAMDELKTMEKMLDLEQESDKLMMEEIKILKMKVMKSLVKNLDYFSLLKFSSSWGIEDLLEWDLIVKRQLVENMILTTKQKLRCEKRKALLTKNSVYSKKGCSYSETCLSKKKTYSKLNCGYSDVFLSTDDNACSERVCNFQYKVKDISQGELPNLDTLYGYLFSDTENPSVQNNIAAQENPLFDGLSTLIENVEVETADFLAENNDAEQKLLEEILHELFCFICGRKNTSCVFKWSFICGRKTSCVFKWSFIRGRKNTSCVFKWSFICGRKNTSCVFKWSFICGRKNTSCVFKWSFICGRKNTSCVFKWSFICGRKNTSCVFKWSFICGRKNTSCVFKWSFICGKRIHPVSSSGVSSVGERIPPVSSVEFHLWRKNTSCVFKWSFICGRKNTSCVFKWSFICGRKNTSCVFKWSFICGKEYILCLQVYLWKKEYVLKFIKWSFIKWSFICGRKTSCVFKWSFIKWSFICGRKNISCVVKWSFIKWSFICGRKNTSCVVKWSFISGRKTFCVLKWSFIFGTIP
ncbi:uncharacterized protein LOC114529301 [Dendronephthya gigantea]|uniref:uncharacterized protein LOC114529301 n=1 Tax=Dendronephthya gigantea TaxID=151771 RepID=UPI001069B6E1|nr:uncharacterized protein LOC114529301 [Dendronephthya gigantea]